MAFDFQGFLNKYDVHPEVVSFIKAMAADGFQPYYEIGVEEARKSCIRAAELYGGTVDFPGTEKEILVPSPDVPEGIPVSVYRPKSCDQLEAPSIVVYFHGGGNVVGCRKTHETTCKIIARDASCIVVNVEYRMGPEHRFPANHDDAKSVVEWVDKNKSAVGGSEDSSLGVAGDSAGGWQAAVVTQELITVIKFTVLIYPAVRIPPNSKSAEEFEDDPVISRDLMKWFLDNGFSPGGETSLRSRPIDREDVSGHPSTLIIVADLDRLRDDCYGYYEKLKKAGVQVDLLTVKGAIHSFWHLPAHFKECCRKGYAKAVDFINQHSTSG